MVGIEIVLIFWEWLGERGVGYVEKEYNVLILLNVISLNF